VGHSLANPDFYQIAGLKEIMQELLVVQIYLLVTSIFIRTSLLILRGCEAVCYTAFGGSLPLETSAPNRNFLLQRLSQQTFLKFLQKRDIDNGVYYFRGGGLNWPGNWLRRDGYVVAWQELGS
jgi:hypothetical protein